MSKIKRKSLFILILPLFIASCATVGEVTKELRDQAETDPKKFATTIEKMGAIESLTRYFLIQDAIYRNCNTDIVKLVMNKNSDNFSEDNCVLLARCSWPGPDYRHGYCCPSDWHLSLSGQVLLNSSIEKGCIEILEILSNKISSEDFIKGIKGISCSKNDCLWLAREFNTTDITVVAFYDELNKNSPNYVKIFNFIIDKLNSNCLKGEQDSCSLEKTLKNERVRQTPKNRLLAEKEKEKEDKEYARKVKIYRENPERVYQLWAEFGFCTDYYPHTRGWYDCMKTILMIYGFPRGL